MALTNIQRAVCRVLAKQRIASGESYVAGGAALNTLFHDTAAALAATWNADRAALLDARYENAAQIVAMLPYRNVGP